MKFSVEIKHKGDWYLQVTTKHNSPIEILQLLFYLALEPLDNYLNKASNSTGLPLNVPFSSCLTCDLWIKQRALKSQGKFLWNRYLVRKLLIQNFI